MLLVILMILRHVWYSIAAAKIRIEEGAYCIGFLNRVLVSMAGGLEAFVGIKSFK